MGWQRCSGTSWHQTGYPVYSPASLRLQSCSSNGSSSNFNGKGLFFFKKSVVGSLVMMMLKSCDSGVVSLVSVLLQIGFRIHKSCAHLSRLFVWTKVAIIKLFLVSNFFFIERGFFVKGTGGCLCAKLQQQNQYCSSLLTR